jgi:WD40-like Beta Propeller Repeat
MDHPESNASSVKRTLNTFIRSNAHYGLEVDVVTNPTRNRASSPADHDIATQVRACPPFHRSLATPNQLENCCELLGKVRRRAQTAANRQRSLSAVRRLVRKAILALLVGLVAVPSVSTVAGSAMMAKIGCIGRVNNLLFARLKTAEGSVRIEARQLVGKRLLRSLSVTNAEGTAPLFGTKITAKAVAVRVLPNGGRSVIKVTAGCAPATGSTFGSTFVSAIVKIAKGERATINLGVALLSFPANTFSFKSALVKITKPERPAPANPVDAPILGPFVIDTGGQQPTKPFTLEFPFVGTLTPEGKVPISAQFIPGIEAPGTPAVQLPISIGGGIGSVAIPGPGQIVITPTPSPLPPGPPLLPGREPGEPGPAALEPETPAKNPTAPSKPTKPNGVARGGLGLYNGGKPQSPINPIMTAPILGSRKPTVVIETPTDPEERQHPIGWAPDASKFTYSRYKTTLVCQPGDKGTCRQVYSTEIWIADANGTNQRFLFKSSSNSTWAPNGKQLAVQPDKGGIAIIGLNGEILNTILIEHSQSNNLPIGNLHWSPDGNYIAFTEGSNLFLESVSSGTNNYSFRTHTLFIVRPDGTDLRALYSDEVGFFLNGWDPKIDRIAIDVRNQKRLLNETGPGPIATTSYWVPIDGSPRQLIKDRSSYRYPLGQSCSLWARGGCGLTQAPK